MRGTTDANSPSLFLTDGGIETHLIFNMGVDLPLFSAFILNDTDQGQAVMRRYYRDYLPVAKKLNVPFQFATDTWRANPDWGTQLGYDAARLKANNMAAVKICADMQAEFHDQGVESCICGLIGPRRDAWKYDSEITATEARDYHIHQIEAFAQSGRVDEVAALTLTNTPEAIGIAAACRALSLPVVVSFTVETDGALPGGKLLSQAVDEVDQATQGGVAYYMVNCAYPKHFSDTLANNPHLAKRIAGIRTNASAKSHAELDASPELDAGDLATYGPAHDALFASIAELRVLGGCCGTDHRHVAALCSHCLSTRAPTRKS